MAVASLCKSFSSKLYFTPSWGWASSRIRLRDRNLNAEKIQSASSAVPVCHIWAGPIHTTPKIPEQSSARATKPKQPPNVFILYLQRVQEQIQKDNPKLSRTELVAVASQQWKNVDPEEKSILAMQRKEMFEKYKKEIKSYYDNMTPEEMKLEEMRKNQKMAKKLKTARQELGMPKMPASPFCCFMAEQYQLYAGEDKVTRVFKKLRDHWRNLSDAEKETYKRQSSQRSEDYRNEMERWEKEMMEMGRFDVIRKSTLMRLAMGNKPKRSKKEAEYEEL